MYTEYWQLEAKPFEPNCDERFHFPCASQQAALNKLQYAVDSGRAAAMIAGASGCGKSLVIRLLESKLQASVGNFIQLVFPLMSTRDLLTYLAEEIGAPAADPPLRTVEESLRRLEFALEERDRRGKHTVLVIEEAHLLEDSGLLETLRLLINLQAAGRTKLTLLLVGQPPLLSGLRRHATLDERLDMKVLLKPFTEQETADYIIHRLNAAGASRPIFSAAAMDAVHRLSSGIPRQINRLCDLALVVGFAASQESIDPAHLESVHKELVSFPAAA